MIFKKLRNNFSLLIDSSRHVWTFELAYKLVAFAVIFPIVLFTINFLMKIAGVNYLTNEYIQRAMTHPVVIFAIFLAMGIFVFYCTYEMTYLSVCFETKRTSCNASVVDIFYNSYKVFKNVFKPRHVGLSIFYFISILASNVTVWFNVLYSETNTNLIKMYIIRNHWYIKAEVIFMFVIIYAIVIPGIYAMNICMMEGLGFREAYKKSAHMVKKHPMGTISALVVYNLVMLAIIGITYVLISVFLVAGVKILNMAYLGNAIFLSALRTERLIIKCILVCVAIPLSFSAISHMYYKYTDVDDITFEFTDIAGIVKGASKGEGLGNKFLANIREVDAIIHVVRAFDDENVMREQGREDDFVDPMADIDTINLELILADLESINKRYARVEKIARTQKDKDSVAEFNILQKIKPVLEDGKSARTIDFTEEEQKIVKGLFLLTTKPVLYVANVDEDQVANPDDIDYVKQIREFAATENAEVVVISARVEEEISELDDEDKEMFLEDLGLTESGVDKLTRAAYHLLGLGTYFTAGEKEVRAWTFKRGIKAPQAAGIIHSDFEKGFIRAVTMSYDDLIKYGSEKAVKEAGRLREEGKEYVVQDGDIMEFRFNV